MKHFGLYKGVGVRAIAHSKHLSFILTEKSVRGRRFERPLSDRCYPLVAPWSRRGRAVVELLSRFSRKMVEVVEAGAHQL